MVNFLISMLFCFGGYIVGRVGHIKGGHLNVPHHWIWGVLIDVVSLILVIFGINYYAVFSFMFGLGLIFSDLNDFLNLRIMGPDDVSVKKFWGFD